MSGNGQEPKSKVQVEFNQSTTGKGEGYRVACTDEATEADVRRAVNLAEEARRLSLNILGRVCCQEPGFTFEQLNERVEAWWQQLYEPLGATAPEYEGARMFLTWLKAHPLPQKEGAKDGSESRG